VATDVPAHPVLPRRLSRLLLVTLLVSAMGDEITHVALVFRVAPGGSGAEVAALLIALLLPGALVAPYAGKLVDESDAARVLAVASAGQALVSTVLAFSSGVTAAISGAALLSLLFAFSGAATFALIPVVGRSAGLPIARVNAALELASGGGSVLGPLIGGLLVALGGATLAFLVDAATFSLLATMVLVTKLRREAQPPDQPGWSPGPVLRSYAPVLRDRRILILLTSFWIIVAALGVADAVYAFLVIHVLGLGPVAYGAFMAAWAVSYLIGAWLAAGLAERRPHRLAMIGGSIMGASFLAIGLAGKTSILSPALVAAAFFAGGFGNAFYNVAVRTILHLEVPEALHGRAAAVYGAGIRCAEASGFIAGGLMGPAHVLTAYILSGLGALAAAASGTALQARWAKDGARER
jgi:MFS family permease